MLSIMQKFENRFGVNVELRSVGDHVVAAKIMMSLGLVPSDRNYVFDRILDQLLPIWVDSYRLYDGSYFLLSNDANRVVSAMCVPIQVRSLGEFDATVELEDGLLHTVHISLEQSDCERHDYTVLGTRFIQLRGKIAIEVEGDETGKC